MSSLLKSGAGGIAVLAVLVAAAPFETIFKPGIRHVATLRAARAVHTVTALPTGLVLIAGGMSAGENGTATAELFDPARNTIEAADSLIDPRSGHTATLLPDGRVLIAGGMAGRSYLRSVEVFDPSRREFRRAGGLREARSGHTATLLSDGRVLIAGGVGTGWTYLRSAEVYDPKTGSSEAVGSLSVPRESHTATRLGDGRVLIVGGHNQRRPNLEVHALAELFSPATGRFTAAGVLATPRHKHDAVLLSDGRVLVIGGADRTDDVHYATTEIYDTRAGRFSAGPSMRHERYKIAGSSVRLPDGRILVAGGARYAEVLDADGSRFRPVHGAFPTAFRFAASALLHDGDVVVTGGYGAGVAGTDGVWRFSSR